jgi:hypothetical protein
VVVAVPSSSKVTSGMSTGKRPPTTKNIQRLDDMGEEMHERKRPRTVSVLHGCLDSLRFDAMLLRRDEMRRPRESALVPGTIHTEGRSLLTAEATARGGPQCPANKDQASVQSATAGSITRRSNRENSACSPRTTPTVYAQDRAFPRVVERAPHVDGDTGTNTDRQCACGCTSRR